MITWQLGNQLCFESHGHHEAVSRQTYCAVISKTWFPNLSLEPWLLLSLLLFCGYCVILKLTNISTVLLLRKPFATVNRCVRVWIIANQKLVTSSTHFCMLLAVLEIQYRDCYRSKISCKLLVAMYPAGFRLNQAAVATPTLTLVKYHILRCMWFSYHIVIWYKGFKPSTRPPSLGMVMMMIIGAWRLLLESGYWHWLCYGPWQRQIKDIAIVVVQTSLSDNFHKLQRRAVPCLPFSQHCENLWRLSVSTYHYVSLYQTAFFARGRSSQNANIFSWSVCPTLVVR